jgi:hypothetical protein
MADDARDTPESIERVIRRTKTWGFNPREMTMKLFTFYACCKLEGVHPLEGGHILKHVLRDTTPEEDIAMVPPQADDFEALEMYTATQAARDQVEKQRRKAAAAASVSVP